MDMSKSKKYADARASLPVELISVFDELVADYRYSATLRHGAPFVSYIVLADLVKSGWRPSRSEEPQGRNAAAGKRGQ